jgi:dTDP-4-amino-4,6-dideoxygalactose transaminase
MAMKVPLLDLPGQYQALKPELDEVWFGVMGSAGFIGGVRVKALEEAVAAYCGTDHAVACANGTDALFTIMTALNIGPGDEVITTPFTFWATVECIKSVGATPIFVDIEPGTYNLDVSKLETVITERTKAILPVHIFGQCVDMEHLLGLAVKYHLYVVEDACQAIGATYHGQKAGSLGHVAAFSFFPSKNLGCAGDGGMITTNNGELAARCRKIVGHGTTKKYYHDEFGTNSRLDALQAGILSVKLPHLDEWNDQRRVAAKTYSNLLDGSGLELPQEHPYGKAVYHLYIVKAKSASQAERLMAHLLEKEIGTALYYPLALHEQEAFTKDPAYKQPHLPVAESCDGRTFALPCFPGITRSQIDYVVNALEEAL